METDLHRRKGRTKFVGPTPHSLAKLIEWKRAACTAIFAPISQKPGFLANLLDTANHFRKKTWFLATRAPSNFGWFLKF